MPIINSKESPVVEMLRKRALEVTGKPSTVYGLTYDQKEHHSSLSYIQDLFRLYRRDQRLDLAINLCHEMNQFHEAVWNDHARTFDGRFFSERMAPDKIVKHHNIQTADGIIVQNLILAGYSSKFMNYIGIGIGTDEATQGQVALSNEVTRLPCNRDGWHVPAADILNTGIIFGSGTPTNIYTEMGGFTGSDALEDFMGWRVLFPAGGSIDHTIGETIILLNHIQETIALS